ncbi:sugar phosphate isomerase/epimerase family protein [Algoriphagus boritolerans]|uniref:D-psicose/D-tagatose/L-ribulose 3-epimerase n=1 Tax=Algoriphagus boritolerans DSM 17298 = JCM 18970 TaxID=1120964 RepID=A0A1H5XJI0_9BACT|nr:sugar phosphate isomerase/epimerase family protein [Algoriphagus boritolerans]SEG11921.1 D-psicose/D-tagatose/L-ribulose 3-epimerase [Algoriphagus boritolerans DSM 17298 = JCM 18970]
MALNVTFAVSTWLWTSPFNKETVTLFPKIKSYGYDAVEIPVEDPALVDVDLVKKALADHDLRPVICGAFGTSRDLTHEDPAFHQTCFDYLDACFEIAAELGAGFVAGPMYSAVGKARLISPEQKKIEWNRAVTNLRKVCHRAGEFGLEIAIESLNRFETDLINTADELMQLITDINEPQAKAILDGFHMNIEEPSIEHAIKTVGDKLIHVQVSENYRGTPGTGQTNWAAWKRGLEAINYQGVISIESFTPEVKELAGAVCIWKPLVPSQDGFAKEGLEFLKKWARE